jgi:oligoendopeptidase F
MNQVNKQAKELLNSLNKKYYNLHKKYEDLFWKVYMGEHGLTDQMNEALAKRDAFKSDKRNLQKVESLLAGGEGVKKTGKPETSLIKRLEDWKGFFQDNQVPDDILKLKNEISDLEGKIHKILNGRKEGYINPKTKKFTSASMAKMGNLQSTHPDEKVRKACYTAMNKLSKDAMKEFVDLVNLRNEYARERGYEDFYDFHLSDLEGMSKKELTKIFGDIYQDTKHSFGKIKKLEKHNPGITRPWNYAYMMSGDFRKEEDQYFQFEEALGRWGKSFAAMGIRFRGGEIKMDLLDRKGKHGNGFCHWPKTVLFESGKRNPGAAGLTCNVVPNQIGSGFGGYITLFHEGGHAAHLLNSEQKEVFFSHEYEPMSVTWAEIQSMFLDSVMSSPEWCSRYAKNEKGEAYPMDLYEKRVKKVSINTPLRMNGILYISEFELLCYAEEKLTKKRLGEILKHVDSKYYGHLGGRSPYTAMNVPHIYQWDSAAYYHGYGLAELGLSQLTEYLRNKYGYIVDNPNVYKELQKVWKLGGSLPMKELVVLATGKKLSAKAYLKKVNRPAEKVISDAKKNIKRLEKVPHYKKRINLEAKIRIFDGKKEISNNSVGFEQMAEKYKKWIINRKKKD